MAKINITKKRKEFEVSQEYLARVLGVSRPTLVKIEKGERKLKKEEEEKLKEFFDSLSIERQEENLKVSIPKESKEKFEQVLLYILQKVGAKPNVGLTVLYKLLYFIDFGFYERYRKHLMGLTYIKNTHGPTPRNFKKLVSELEGKGVVEEVQSSFFKRDQKKYLPHKSPDLSKLSAQELAFIDEILLKYSDKTAKELSELSHKDTPWKAVQPRENLDYDLVFYRPDELSVGEYDEL